MYYLDQEVEPVQELRDDDKLPQRPVLPAPDGWIWCRWPDKKLYMHWRAQLKMTPYGDNLAFS